MEKERGIEPDPDIDAFMKADAIEGKRESIETEYVLHILGLNVCSETMVSLKTFFPTMSTLWLNGVGFEVLETYSCAQFGTCHKH